MFYCCPATFSRMSYKHYLQILVVLISCKNILNQVIDNPTITIEDGSVRGKLGKTVGDGKSYYAFQGIPYAKPPLGDLRFQPPVRNDKWNNTLEATQDKSECVQGFIDITGSEDCLYLNVYTPAISEEAMPVMVWIYGGYFFQGDSSYTRYGPDYFLDADVIFVSFNYRLGIFGFLSTEDLVCPGNMGLKDQLLALQWVQKNIKYFGGDPRNVTVFGQSAGAVSVSYQLQSPLSKGLFKAAILESGSSLCLWALEREARDKAFKVGIAANVDTTNSTTLIEGLRRADYKDLQGKANFIILLYLVIRNPLAGILPYVPVMEPYHEGAFFYNKSDLLLSTGNFRRVPVLMGFTENEAASFFDSIPGIFYLYFILYDLFPQRLTPVDLTKTESKILSAGLEIKQHYFGLIPIALQQDEVVEFCSDDQFNRPIRRMVLAMNPYSPTYLYKFSYKGEILGLSNRTSKETTHTEELRYLFRVDASNVPPSDILIRSRMVKLWTNFAKYGNPTPVEDPLFQHVTWLQTGTALDKLWYLNIDTDMELKTNPFEKNMKFYDTIYTKYGDPPYDTY